MADPVRVLLVDDEPDFQEALAFWFKSKGYHITAAQSGAEALEMIKASPPNVVFLDVMMPGMDGIETLRRLRAFNKTLPVILVTAAVQEDNKFAGAKALGISGIFPKGSSLNELTQVLQVALRHLRPAASPAGQAPAAGPVPSAAQDPSPGPASASWWDRLRGRLHRSS